MQDTNALFDSLLAAYRNADDPDRFLREFLMRLDDATANAVVAAERKLDKLDAARARLEAAREIPRPDASDDGADAPQDVEDDDEPVEDEPEPEPEPQDREEDEAPPPPKQRKPTRKRTPAR
jgi:hypothetical protein